MVQNENEVECRATAEAIELGAIADWNVSAFEEDVLAEALIVLRREETDAVRQLLLTVILPFREHGPKIRGAAR